MRKRSKAGANRGVTPAAATAPAATRPAAAPAASAPAVSSPAAAASAATAGFSLPASGLASEILGNLRGNTAAPGRSPRGRERVYSFADALEQRGRDEGAGRVQEQPESWVVFELAAERYGLPVTAVQEVLRVDAVTRVPDSPPPVRGITSLRGRVLAVVDLRMRLGLPPAAVDARSRILVVDSRRRVLGLLVDAALEVCKLLPSALAAPPHEVMTARSDYIRGVVQLDDQLIIALDLDRVLLIHDEDEAPGVSAEPAPGRMG
jgi:purine-binding chemotaxis protein CheW